jgi:hypothetical protein
MVICHGLGVTKTSTWRNIHLLCRLYLVAAGGTSAGMGGNAINSIEVKLWN